MASKAAPIEIRPVYGKLGKSPRSKRQRRPQDQQRREGDKWPFAGPAARRCRIAIERTTLGPPARERF